MTAEAPIVFVGWVEHRRFGPARHRLRYRLFQFLVDLDDNVLAGQRPRLFSRDRFNLFSLFETDHGDGRAGSLRGWVDETLARAGVDLAGGRVLLLAMPRVLGYVFNPISLYFCHRADGALAAMIYEVNNTFGQRHSYVIPVEGVAHADQALRQSCAKILHVSPFLPMGMRYEFRVRRSPQSMALAIDGLGEDGGRLIHARFVGLARPLTDAVLASLLFSHPLLTLKVIGAIHFEAARLALKGVRPQPRPPLPAPAATVAARRSGGSPHRA